MGLELLVDGRVGSEMKVLVWLAKAQGQQVPQMSEP